MWPNDFYKCPSETRKLTRKTHNYVLSSWKINHLSGIMTGSIYMDYGLRMHGFPAENVTDGSVLVVKTHEAPPLEPDKFKSAILLIRNPRDAILVRNCVILFT